MVLIFAPPMRLSAFLFITLLSIDVALSQPGRSGFDDGKTVVSTFKPKLLNANKLIPDPTVPKGSSFNYTPSYTVQDYRWNTRKITRILPPAKHFEPGTDTSYNPNYARIGGGNLGHKLVELYVANRANSKWAYNAAFQHLSADASQNKTTPRLTHQDFSSNRGYISGSRFFKRSSLDMRVNYNRDMNRFYAKDTFYVGDLALKKKIGQDVGFNLLYDQKATDRKAGFSGGFMFNNFYNNLNQSETEFGGLFGWDARFKKFSTFGNLQVSNLQFRQASTTTKQWFIELNPKVKYHDKEKALDVTAGLNLAWAFRDTFSPIFYLNPYVLAEKQLEGLKMKLYGGIDGGLRKNSIRRYFETVPFTYDSIKIYNTYEQLRLFAGLKGRITENSQFNVEFGNSTMAYMPLIVTNGDSIRSLQVIYDDLNVTYFSADMRFSIGEKLRVGAGGKFNNYGGFGTETEAWHLPDFTYFLSGQYNLRRNFVFQLGIDGMSRRYNKVLDGSNNQLEMKGFADLNCRVDYIIKDMFRLWVQGSNLMNMKYQMWYGYDNYRMTILGGLSASF
jgi:hypothetical protein